MAELVGPALTQPGAPGASLDEIHREATICTRCELYKHAAQLVFGEGPKGAEVVFVGEQPGDKEDVAGQPFVGPAGKLLDRCLEEAGIERASCYVTNAVKHFKFEPRGKRRIHAKPTRERFRCARGGSQPNCASCGRSSSWRSERRRRTPCSGHKLRSPATEAPSFVHPSDCRCL